MNDKTEAPPDEASAALSADAEAEQDVTAPESFDDWELSDEIRQGLHDLGYFRPMAVQAAVWTPASEGRDIMVQSKTGSGKTAAFGLPLVEKISTESSGAQVLILAPTRELARQVCEELSKITKHKSITVIPVYGGAPINKQIDQLKAGAQIIAGTPGRVLDHIRRRTLKTDGIKTLVLDECDEMLSMGFQEEIENIIETLPKKTERQTMLFSARIPDSIQRIARRHMTDHVALQLSGDDVNVDEIDHHYYVVSGMARSRDLLKILAVENPDSAIIFCNTRDETAHVARYLERSGYDAAAISSDLSQRDRERVMKKAREGRLRFMVATDIAARGIDITQLSHVINYTFPESPEVYVHRTGRTGRAGNRGTAISLVGPREIGSFYYLKLTYKIIPEERDMPGTEVLAGAEEAQRYNQVLKMVGEKPSDEYVDLARRLWKSDNGERVVGALLERLLNAPALPTKKPGSSASGADAEPADVASDDRRPQRDRSSDRNGGGRSRRPRGRRDERPQTADPAEPSAEVVEAASTTAESSEPSDGKRRRRRRRRRPSEDGAAAVSSTPDEALELTPDEAVEATNDEAEGQDNTAVTIAEREPRKKRPRRRRGSASGGGSDAKSTAEPGEFWETWAEEKTGSSNGETAAAPSEDTDSVRLYVNVGKREELTVDEVRSLLTEGMNDEQAEMIGKIALRNTHCYVHVPETIADTVISAAEGKSVGERELVVERARR